MSPAASAAPVVKKSFGGFRLTERRESAVGDCVRVGVGVRVVVDSGGGWRDLDPRFDLRKHSPDGFEWGYRGSGPAQLALALCAEVVGELRALRSYQRFKDVVVASLPVAGWSLSEDDVLEAVVSIEAEGSQ